MAAVILEVGKKGLIFNVVDIKIDKLRGEDTDDKIGYNQILETI